MLLNIGIFLIIGLVNFPIQIKAEDETHTCLAHEKWTVFQRRKYGNVDFNRGWDDYVNGFGDCDGDLWLGLEELHELTKGNDMSLEINMMSKGKKDHLWAKYRNFRIGPGSDNYRLHVSGYSGNADDAFSRHYNQQFSTQDADHDDWPSYNCASDHEGGWWYDGRCGLSNLNGNFHKTDRKGIWWWADFDGQGRPFPRLLRYLEMKIYKRCVAHEKGTVFQRRKYGNVDFFRGWDDYVNGFGDCDGDYWLGLEELHQSTKEDDMSLEISMMSKDEKEHFWARYSNFSIGHGSENYTLHVSGYSGNATYNALVYHNNRQFSTKDVDHDDRSLDNCASLLEGGWWYGNCSASNLNGNFNKTDAKGIWWRGDVPDQDLRSPNLLGYSEMRFYKHKRYAAEEKWTVFQRRKYGNVSFYRSWDDYANGFGDCDGDFWLGLKALHQLTKGDDMSLEINMMSKGKKDHLWAKYRLLNLVMRCELGKRGVSVFYSQIQTSGPIKQYRVDRRRTAQQLNEWYFRIGPGSDFYRLYVSGFSGNAEDGLSFSNNFQFSTKDADHGWSSGNCATDHEGGWWYDDGCGVSNLNGNFNKTDRKGIWWWRDYDVTPHDLCCSEMKVYKRN